MMIVIIIGMIRKYGWHIGDKIPLISSTLQTNGSGTWTFDIVGMYTLHGSEAGIWVLANYDYIDEARERSTAPQAHG